MTAVNEEKAGAMTRQEHRCGSAQKSLATTCGSVRLLR